MEIKKISDEEFNSIFSANIDTFFSSTMSFSVQDVRTEYEIQKANELKSGLKLNERIHLVAHDDNGEFAGWSTSSQFRQYSLYTHNSVVFPKFRRQGVYSALVKETLRLAEESGYQIVFSNHVLSNNDVIIAKLKLGFKIMGIEVFDDYGSTAKLVYHINEKRKKLFDFRTGQIRPDEEIRNVFKI